MWLIRKTKKPKLTVKIISKTEISRTHLIIQRSKKEKKKLFFSKVSCFEIRRVSKGIKSKEMNIISFMHILQKKKTLSHKLPFPSAVLAAEVTGTFGL